MTIELKLNTLNIEDLEISVSPEKALFKTQKRIFEIIPIKGADSKIVLKTLKYWKNLIMERLGDTRKLNNEQRSEETKEKLEYDLQVVDQYKELISRFEMLLNNTELHANYKLKLLRDADNNIQALCSAELTSDAVYIKHVFTAPWNLKMFGKIDEIYRTLVTKGCGTILMASCYQEAEKNNKKELRLKPLSGSFSYYKDKLQMQEDKAQDEFFYLVIPEKFPEGLLKSLKEI